jgi:uncharacterized protein (DUF58 family)
MDRAELMKDVRRLQVLARRAVTEIFSGEYASAFRGRGMEFEEVREYQPGDDVRTIDWNVTARAGKPYVKRYVEERELTALLVVDLSASGMFGSTAKLKRRVMLECAALVSFVAAMNNDRAALVTFTDRVEAFIPPRKGSVAASRILRELIAGDPIGHGTNLAAALEFTCARVRRRSLLFVVSDLIAPGGKSGETDAALALAAGRHELIALHVRDQREAELEPVGLLSVIDPETGQGATIDTRSAKVRSHYRAAMARSAAHAKRAVLSAGGDYAEVWTHRPPADAILDVFRRRERRR